MNGGARTPFRQSGFTLVEILASMLVFSVVTIGMIPLISASLRSAALARSESVAKALTEKGMEQIRSLPFYVSYGTSTNPVDVLDLYFPDKTAPPLGNYIVISNGPPVVSVYRTICDSSSTDPACPRPIPAGYTMTIEAQFVNPGTLDASGNQTFAPLDPLNGYTWSQATYDTPRTRILRVKITTTWNFGVTPHSYALTELVGERGFQTDRVRGDAVVDYSVQVLTGFKRADGSKSYLVSTMGSGESRIHTREVSEAGQTANGGVLRLTRDDSVVGAGADLLTGVGATSSAAAPPDETPAGAAATEKTILHPDIAQAVGFLDDSATSDQASAQAGTPEAAGSFVINAQPISAGDVLNNWVTNQAVTGAGSTLRLAAALPMFSVRPAAADAVSCVLLPSPSCGSSAAVSGNTLATAVALSSPTRSVQAKAYVSKVGEVHLFPVTFLAGAVTARSVIRITGFNARTECTATPLSGAAYVAAFGATFQYWNGTLNQYVSISLDEVDGTGDDTLQELYARALVAGPTAVNPKVFDDPNPLILGDSPNDIWLFNDPAKSRAGYLSRASSMVAPPVEMAESGRYVSATIDGAIRLDTVPTDPAIPQSRLNISIGKLACEAIDRR